MPHEFSLFGGQVHVGLFGSTTIEVRLRGDVLSASQSLSQLDGCLLKTDASRVKAANEIRFEIGARSSGTTRFQWRFVGALLPDNGFVIVRGGFRPPRILQTFFVLWFVGVGLFAALSAGIAVAARAPAMWLMSVGALVVAAIGYVTLLVGRSMTEPAIHRIALDLDRWAHRLTALDNGVPQ